MENLSYEANNHFVPPCLNICFYYPLIQYIKLLTVGKIPLTSSLHFSFGISLPHTPLTICVVSPAIIIRFELVRMP